MNKYDQKMSIFKGYYARDGELKATGLPVSMGDILQVEKFFGHELPADYLEFVSKYGGFSPGAYAYFPIKPFPGGSRGILSGFFGIGLGEDDPDDLLLSCQTYKGRIPSNLLPIASDPGDNVICFSVDGPDKGYVYFWDKEEEIVVAEGEPPDDSNLHLVARSFDEFIEALEFEDQEAEQGATQAV